MIRVLNDPAFDGPANMARDEALLTSVGDAESPPTLRLYQWDPPTISLGYFQRYADFEDLSPPAGNLPVVRRQTGGGAILHDRELTYSLTLPTDHALIAQSPARLYELAHDAMIACLGSLGISAQRGGRTDDSSPTRGPFFCFARRHRFDVLIGEGKVIGSAQRRTGHAVLQHGSIILGNRYAQQPTAAVLLDYEDASRKLRPAIVQQLALILGEAFEPGEWPPAELALADTIAPKYGDIAWTKRV